MSWKVLSLSLPLSKMLQSINNDIFKSNDLINEVLNVLRQRRQDHEERFHEIMLQVEAIACRFGIPLTIRRRANLQTGRGNYPSRDLEEYRQAVHVPFMDYIIHKT